MLMRLSWPITDGQVGKLALIDEALADYQNVVARAGYIAAGLPHDWDIEARRTGGGRRQRTYLVCFIEVARAWTEAA